MAKQIAIIERRNGNPSVETVEAYLPSNYWVADSSPESITIEGEDKSGWTLNNYVIPRLASGLIWAKKVI